MNWVQAICLLCSLISKYIMINKKINKNDYGYKETCMEL